MATAKKLPSGSWRCRVYSHTEETRQPDGAIKEKKIYKSFTCDDPSAKGKRICEAEAAAWAAEKTKETKYHSMTFKEGLESYVASRNQILSASTLREYKRYVKNGIPTLDNIKIDDITQQDIQKAINIYAATHAPKTVKNYHGVITAVMGTYRPNFRINTALPQKRKANLYIPTDDEVAAILNYVQGTSMEIPVMLAVFGPMRRGEICGLTTDYIRGNRVHVYWNLVKGPDNQLVKKAPKSVAGDRFITYPQFVIDKLSECKGNVTDMTPAAITMAFDDVLKNLGIKHFRFHDLRHYCVSTMHKIGIPDADIIVRAGWSSVSVLHNIYLHATQDKIAEMDRTTNRYFAELYDTKYDTSSKNADK